MDFTHGLKDCKSAKDLVTDQDHILIEAVGFKTVSKDGSEK